MKQIIIVVAPLGECVDRDICKKFGRDFFAMCDNIDDQWKRLEGLRDTGGVIFVQPESYSAIRELLDSYIDEDGFVNSVGNKIVHTQEHVDFWIYLFCNAYNRFPNGIIKDRELPKTGNKEVYEEHGSMETKPHKEGKATVEGLTVEQYIQVMEERMDEFFNKEGVYKNGFGRIPKDCMRFKGIIDRMYDTFKQKNADYGNSFRELYKECGMTYAYGHMREKLERVRSLMKNETQVKGESMKDSLYDLANYAVLTIMEIERNKGKDD